MRPSTRPSHTRRRLASVGLIGALALSLVPVRAVTAVSPDLVVSQVYGGGGNAGATFTTDFIELYNRGAAPASLNGLSLQYASATGTGNFGANSGQLTELPSVSLAPGSHFLVAQASGANGAPLPVTPDLVDPTPINMSGTAGKVALVTGIATLGCNGGSTPCAPDALARIVDLVGYGNANFFEGTAAAPTLSATTAALRAGGGATDTDDNAADFTAATPNPRSSTDAAPSVTSTTPAHQATGVSPGATIQVTFSEPVAVTDPWFTIACVSTGSHAATVSGGPTTYSIDPTVDFGPDESCTLTIAAAEVADLDTNDPPDQMAADHVVTFTTSTVEPCEQPFTTIPEIQGSGQAAAITGPVTTQGVVVGDYEGPAPAIRGFYLQDAAGDGDPATSDALFVFNANDDEVSLGDVVRVSGNATEFQDQTQIEFATITDCEATGDIEPTDVTFPVASTTFLERFEGMLVRLPQTMVVTEHFQLGRFGQVVLAAETRLRQPTATVAPGAPAAALQAANDLRKIILDDALQNQNPDPILWGRDGDPLSASNTLRGGDTATGIVGVMTYTWAGNAASGNAFRIRPIGALDGVLPDFQPANPRSDDPPEVGGTIRVAGMNLLNYFDTFDGLPDNVDNCSFGTLGPPADCRGADTQTEFDRQWPKTVAAILDIDADVLGVNEIQNDGYGPTSSIAHLVGKLNAEAGPGTYAYIDVDAGTGQVDAAGTDAIKVGLIYKPASVTPVGQTAALNSVAFVNGGDSGPRSRPSIAQAFETADGARFVVDVNHFKSKGSACDAPDAGDGQGNCNQVRTNAANVLAAWLASDPTGTGDDDILIVGDLNSYTREDPIVALETAGYTNLVGTLLGPDAYSFVFDGQWGYLDYALASGSALTEVEGVGEYHINADEPNVLDYNTDFKSPAQIAGLYAPDKFRVSDHDPILVGLSPVNDPPSADAGGPYTVVEGGTVALAATGADPEGTDVSFSWDLDGNGTFETPGRTPVFSAAALEAPATRTITVRVEDAFGNATTDDATVTVIWDFRYRFPIQAPPAVNRSVAGLPVPITFSLDGDQGLGVLDGAPTFQRTDCATGAPIGDAQPTESVGQLVYVRVIDRYIYLWRTRRSMAGWCGTFVLHLEDGTSHEALFRFR